MGKKKKLREEVALVEVALDFLLQASLSDLAHYCAKNGYVLRLEENTDGE